ncbi:MAG: hypothetical protein ACI9VT_000012 [Psychroserpens sp.]|jgi:hypothetical protein
MPENAGLLDKVTAKALLPLWAILVLLALLDITTRLQVAPSASQKAWQLSDSQITKGVQITAGRAMAINLAIDKYEQASALAPTQYQMSNAEQLAQEGDLEQLYSGDMRYRLVGIFKQQSAFAVIEQEHLRTNEKENNKVTLQSTLNDYQVNEILSNKIVLMSKEKRQVTLYLYK